MLFGKKKRDDASDDRIQVDTRTITTMVGQDTVVTGGLTTKSSVRINGTVIGDIKAGGVVILTKTGHIEGTVEAESIIVAGRIDGNMSIRDKVNVEATGQIYGEIITKKFVIDEESIFQGNCIMNRDGKVIPVTPYKNGSDEEEEKSDQKDDDKQNKPDDGDSDKKASEDTEDTEDKSEAKESDKDDNTEENKDDKNADNNDKEESSKDSEAEIKSKSEDDSIKIAHIDDVESADDIPDNDDAIKPKNKNYVKKSKSLSVEIENQ